jgi:hypothetical protein
MRQRSFTSARRAAQAAPPGLSDIDDDFLLSDGDDDITDIVKSILGDINLRETLS